MIGNVKVLVCDDDVDVLSALEWLLQAESMSPVTVDSPGEALTLLKRQAFDLVIADLNYSSDTTSGVEGIEFIQQIRSQDDHIPIVVMTGWGTIDIAVRAMQQGANDFVQKPWENDRLLSIINNQLKLSRANRKVEKLVQQKHQLEVDAGLDEQELIAESAAMRRVMTVLQQVARTDANVLITGENGTGKSLLARHLHRLSSRGGEDFVAVNMGAVTETLFESEMFGHVKGAFTDAKQQRIGRFELADGGTLFLDEIANTPYTQQGKLLRVLEERQFERVGESKTRSVDVRLIAATNAELAVVVEQGEFRKDLLYRLNTVELHIPPLRQRPEDILPLAQRCQTAAAAKYDLPVVPLSDEARQALLAYSWPGNVRELAHVMERAQILALGKQISAADLGISAGSTAAADSQKDSAGIDLRPIRDIEADILRRRMDYFDGNAEKAAASLGLTKSTFYRQLGKAREQC